MSRIINRKELSVKKRKEAPCEQSQGASSLQDKALTEENRRLGAKVYFISE
jgi:hypothetical protein